MHVLPTVMQQYIHLSRYARWLYGSNRRETWEETVARYFDFFEGHLAKNNKFKISKALRAELESSVLNLKTMPSMRCLMTAGEALERDNIAGYNCSYTAIDNIRSFDEIMFILLCGTGSGFSVERKYVDQLPVIAENFFPTDTTIIVADSKLGWAKSLKELIHLLYAGQIPKWDITKVRPAGAPLKTFGGRASGPDPLVDVFEFVVRVFKNAAGRKLKPIECHDIVCKIAEVVVVGGVRRSALISLSDVSDDSMREAKSGQWWISNPQRALANISYVVEDKKLDMATFMQEWQSLYLSKSGERGIFSRYACKIQASKNERRISTHEFGTNPCSEIILRNKEFCNLSEVVIRENDTLETLTEKVIHATILGTFQSTLTEFRYLTKKWSENCEEERLLGVSLTGIMDNVLTNGKKGVVATEEVLGALKKVAIDTNNEWSKKLGINPSVAITCVKPSGTVSQLVDASSGIHARHSPYYIRTIRGDKKDPLAKMMVECGFPVEDDVMNPSNVWVFSFPVKAPENSVFRKDITAIQQLELWKIYQDFWCEHKPSVTISVKDDEWMTVGAWVYQNFEQMSGVSFLPFSDHSYKQAPYQECIKEVYEEHLKKMPSDVDWSNLVKYETTDATTGSQELSCVAGICDIQ